MVEQKDWKAAKELLSAAMPIRIAASTALAVRVSESNGLGALLARSGLDPTFRVFSLLDVSRTSSRTILSNSLGMRQPLHALKKI